jgi:hypothetical protein
VESLVYHTETIEYKSGIELHESRRLSYFSMTDDAQTVNFDLGVGRSRSGTGPNTLPD